MSQTPSILASISQLRQLLTADEKAKCLFLAVLAIVISVLEILTASSVVILAETLTSPSAAEKYLQKLGFSTDISVTRMVLWVALGCGATYFIKNMLSAGEVFYQNFTIQKIAYRFRQRLLRRYSSMSYEDYKRRSSSYGFSVMSSDSEFVFNTGMVPLALILSESIVFCALIGMMVFMRPSLAIFLFAVGGSVFFVLYKFLFPRFYNWGLNLQSAFLGGTKSLFQFFHAYKEMILNRKRDFFLNVYDEHSLKTSHTRAIQNSINNMPRIVVETIFIGMLVGAIGYMCVVYKAPEKMISILGGYLYIGFRLMPGINRLINQLSIFKAAAPSIQRVHEEYLQISNKAAEVKDLPELSFNRSIEFKNVSFEYKDDKRKILDEINFDFKKGECIGICGETGSGKSTLVDLFLGVLTPTAGDVLVDGKYPVASQKWHQKIGYVPQDPYLLDDTILANVAFGVEKEKIDLEKLQKAISGAQLDGLMKKLKDGYNTVVGERGIKLSGGEKQRISIARALYNNPEVLVFDEATSALDSKTETKLMEIVYSLREERTIVLIAHRLSTLDRCDRVLSLANGVIDKVYTGHEFKQKIS